MNHTEIYGKIGDLKIVPVIAIDSEEDALPLADALLAGGLPVAEITFRTDAAAKVIKKIVDERPEMIVGAGTVLSPEKLSEAMNCGAKFAVAPGFNPAVVKEATRNNFPFAPGIMTPTDVEAGLAEGLKILKFFPAGAAGGIKLLKSLAGPYGHTGVKFIPTGGVSLDNLADYLELSAVLAVGGSWIAKRDMIAAKNWAAIESAAKEAVATAARIQK
ncbi:MAG: bifunctional 4-hydroxy-2-oxoglutarate aldolase/2-dehydro-3-deoxy-phosphogluconate aldolase [Lentisphaeria bacterium]